MKLLKFEARAIHIMTFSKRKSQNCITSSEVSTHQFSKMQKGVLRVLYYQ